MKSKLKTPATPTGSNPSAQGRAPRATLGKAQQEAQRPEGAQSTLPPIRIKGGMILCRVCGCSDLAACANGCSWVEEDLCSTCAVAAEALETWYSEARRVNRRALDREVSRRLKEAA